jgi:hypothetical protein
MQIISLVKMNYKIPSSIINGSTAQQEIIPLIVQKILVDLIMTQAYVKIGMTLAIVFLVTAVFIYMIVATTKQVGNCKKIMKNLKGKDGEEL